MKELREGGKGQEAVSWPGLERQPAGLFQSYAQEWSGSVTAQSPLVEITAPIYDKGYNFLLILKFLKY